MRIRAIDFKRVALLVLVFTMVLGGGVPARAVEPNTEVTITGGGWGHGIGMSQFGARGMAEDGYTYSDILGYFYPGTGLESVEDAASPPPDPLRVGINKTFETLRFSSSNGPVEVCLPGESLGGCSLSAEPSEDWQISYDGADCILTEDSVQVYGPGACFISIEWADQPDVQVSFPDVSRTFARGRVLFSEATGGLHIAVELGLEEYLYGIGEMPLSWDDEALKSQVVAARTFAARFAASRAATYWSNGGLRPDCSCNLVWSTSDQAYFGWSDRAEGNATYGAKWRKAVDDTLGQVVVFPVDPGPDGYKLAETFYFSNSGGATENVSDIWGSNQSSYPYLVSQPDPWSERYASPNCAASKIRWCKTLTAGTIATVFGLDELVAIDIIDRYDSGSPADIVVKGLLGGKLVESHYTGRQFKIKLGLVSHFVYSITGLQSPERMAGSDRYATAVEASKATFPTGTNTVYVTTGLDYPDALAGGVGAALESAPVLLVTRTVIPAVTRQEIERLSPSKIVVLGGEGVVSAQVMTQLGSYVAGVERRFGPTRFETAVEVSRGVFPTSVETVYVTGGFSFSDAMVAAPAAIRDGSPLLLVHPNVIPTSVKEELGRLNPSRIIVVGGVAAVPEAIFSALGSYAADVTRISGADRYAVGAAVAATFSAATETVYVAVGTDFPDALAGSALAGQEPGPMLLVQTDRIPDSVKWQLTRIGPGRIVILGGTGVISENVEGQLAVYIK